MPGFRPSARPPIVSALSRVEAASTAASRAVVTRTLARSSMRASRAARAARSSRRNSDMDRRRDLSGVNALTTVPTLSVVRLRSVGQHKQKFQKNTFRSYAPRPQLTRARPSAWRSWWPQSVAQTSKSGAPIRRCAPPATLPIPSARERKSQNAPKTHNRALSSTNPPSVPSAPHPPRSDARRARSSGALPTVRSHAAASTAARTSSSRPESSSASSPRPPRTSPRRTERSTRWRSARAAATSPPAAPTPRWSSGTSSASRSSRPYPGTSTRSTPSSIRPAISTWRRAALRAPCSCTRPCRASRLARCASYPTSRTPTAASPACTTPRTGGRCSRARRCAGSRCTSRARSRCGGPTRSSSAT